MSKIEELKTQFEAAVARMKDEGESALKECFADLFTRFPKVSAVRWTQYTPYFNDGDTCEFSVHDPEIFFDGEDPDACERGDGFEVGWYCDDDEPSRPLAEYWSEHMRPAFKLEQIFNLTFGDHVEVVATREGFRVSEYEHD